MTFRSLVVLSLFLLTGSQCSPSRQSHPKEEKTMKPASGTSLAFTSIGSGGATWRPGPGPFGPQLMIIGSKDRWDKLSSLFPMPTPAASGDDPGALSGVDFAHDRILVFTYGLVGSTGYAIRLEKIQVDTATLFILKGTEPDPGDDAGAAMGHPFHMVVVRDWDSAPAMSFTLNGKPVVFGVVREP